MRSNWLPSATVLVAANLVPLVGVVLFGWDVFAVVFLFWLENVVVGFFNVLRMLWVERGAERMPAQKIAVVPFFIVHYGLFTGIHGTFVFGLFGEAVSVGGFPTLEHVIDVIAAYGLWVAVLALVLSHGFSFIQNYVAAQEYRRVTLQQLMTHPYRRVVVLHLTILLGGFLVMVLQLPGIAVALLVALKIGIDLRAHLREHRTLQPRSI